MQRYNFIYILAQQDFFLEFGQKTKSFSLIDYQSIKLNDFV
ncbi:hypothetical protein BDD43_3250 [Mucilaginibacter gracilis]|uniref:Uncharacterized protein n=1 Tax=Mucilaginibacter gracilis TaxID=423350 RepID=A0A495J262_9SPHI|nr:hypothetical protein BDD43_3250 [Mucilaginibacter gracilis]